MAQWFLIFLEKENIKTALESQIIINYDFKVRVKLYAVYAELYRGIYRITMNNSPRFHLYIVSAQKYCYINRKWTALTFATNL